jgi:REP element-mobilizing transposase RayT
MDRDRIRRKAQKSFRTDAGWWSRGYLPHYDSAEHTQFVTIRLADSVPKHVQVSLNAELGALKKKGEDSSSIGYHRCKRMEALLDAGYGCCVLKAESVADVIIKALENLVEQGHEVLRWVIMPNHIHLLLKIRHGTSLSSVIRFFKGRTGKQANEALGSSGRFWFPEYFDRYIRDSDHLNKVLHYIDQNPVRAGLVKAAADWRFGSAGADNCRGAFA